MSQLEIFQAGIIVLLLVLLFVERFHRKACDDAYVAKSTEARSLASRCEEADEALVYARFAYGDLKHEVDRERDAIDAALARIFGVPLSELAYTDRVDAINDLRRKGVPKLRYFDAPPAMREALIPAGTEFEVSIPIALMSPHGIDTSPSVELVRVTDTIEGNPDAVVHTPEPAPDADPPARVPNEVHFTIERLPLIELTDL